MLTEMHPTGQHRISYNFLFAAPSGIKTLAKPVKQLIVKMPLPSAYLSRYHWSATEQAFPGPGAHHPCWADQSPAGGYILKNSRSGGGQLQFIKSPAPVAQGIGCALILGGWGWGRVCLGSSLCFGAALCRSSELDTRLPSPTLPSGTVCVQGSLVTSLSLSSPLAREHSMLNGWGYA